MNSYGSVSLVSGAIYKLLRHLVWFSPEQDPDPGQDPEPESGSSIDPGPIKFNNRLNIFPSS
jgi:hypothetical protein